MRVVYVSPLPPERSGIADYSAELLPHLAALCELELGIADGIEAGRETTRGLPVRRPVELAERLARGDYDVALYQIGNDGTYHGWIYDLAMRHPGVVVLHEVVLHHLVRQRTLGRGDRAGFVEAMRYAYGRGGEQAGRRAVDTGVPVDPYSFPLFEPIADHSRAILVHNEYCRGRIHRSRTGARVSVVPHHLSLAVPESVALEPAAARAALGVGPDEIVVATFGYITPAKRLEALLRAFAALRRTTPAARLVIVGEVAPRYDIWDSEQAHTPAVTWVGRSELGPFLQWMAAADIAVNLRWPTGGETSGTFVRLLGMGKPVIATRGGAFAEIPAGCCALVDAGGDEVEVLTALLELLARRPDVRREMGDNARRLAAAWTLEASAAGYDRWLRQCVAEDWQPRPLRPPLAPTAGDDIATEVLAHTAAAATDLGVDETDDELLQALAIPLTDLHLDQWVR